MKTTYLVLKKVNGAKRLTAVPQAEWDAIMKENRGRPMEQRRYFINDCIEDEDELDCMYIEVSRSDHKKWNSTNTVSQRNRKNRLRRTHISLDTGASEVGVESLHESIAASYKLEEIVTDRILLEQLRKALRQWKPWAEELLDLYLSGEKRSCTSALCEKYQLGDRAIQKRKMAFEKFVLRFLKK